MKIPEYDEPTMDAIMDRYLAAESRRMRESVHDLFLIARDGTYQELYLAMCQAFAPPAGRQRKHEENLNVKGPCASS